MKEMDSSRQLTAINQSINIVYPPHIDSTKATKKSPPKQNGKPYKKIKMT